MPKTYSMSRKMNLGRYGLSYESIDLTVEGCESPAEAEQEIAAWRRRIEMAFRPSIEAQIKKLNAKARLTMSEEKERETMLEALTTSPF